MCVNVFLEHTSLYYGPSLYSGGQKVSDPWKVELQTLVSSLRWVIGVKSGSSGLPLSDSSPQFCSSCMLVVKKPFY